MDRRDVESRIDRVTVYSVGARVRRIARVAAPFPAVVRFTDLPLSLADDSVRAEVEGGGLATAVRVGLATAAAPAAADEQSPDRVAARRRVALATSEVERLSQALERLGGAPVVQRSTTDEPPAPWAAIVTARRSVVELRAARELALRERLSTARREVEEANHAYEAVADRELRAGTARAAKLHEARKFIELELASAATTGELVVSIEYRVTAAKWAPSYVARLDGESTRLELRAVVAQATGEDWAAVAIQLSTALPDRFAPLPELAPQKIGKRQAAVARTGFRPPPIGSAELFADYDRAFPARLAERIFERAAVRRLDVRGPCADCTASTRRAGRGDGARRSTIGDVGRRLVGARARRRIARDSDRRSGPSARWCSAFGCTGGSGAAVAVHDRVRRRTRS